MKSPSTHNPYPLVNPNLTHPNQCHVIRDTSTRPQETVLELRVRNHPGTMSHITGLFARRGFNLDAILCVPLGDGRTSRILLLVSDEPRLDQVERQLGKLYDVLSVRHRPELGSDYFAQLVPDENVTTV